MASEKLFYVNRRKRKKRFWDSHYLAKRAQACASGSSVAEIWSVFEKISFFLIFTASPFFKVTAPFLFQVMYISGVRR